MTLLEQLEKVAGREIPVFYIEDLLALYEGPKTEAMLLLERHSRVVPIRKLLAGQTSVSGPVFLLVRDHRDGFLVQLVEGMAGRKY